MRIWSNRIGVIAMLASGTAAAQWQPTRPVLVIVPNQPGGGPDFIARLMALGLRRVGTGCRQLQLAVGRHA